jgi:hypothetical protein
MKCTKEDLKLRPNTFLDFAASSQCIRNAFRVLVGPSQSSSIEPIEYVSLRSLLAYIDHASAVAVLQDVAMEEFIGVNNSSQLRSSAITAGVCEQWQRH